MQCKLSPIYQEKPWAQTVQDIIGSCVHCGFCTATCPTYVVLRDERDSPRGRIYLMKEIFEGKEITSNTINHLDRCLTCHSCETTCPSGVQYGKLIDTTREIIAKNYNRNSVKTFKRFLILNIFANTKIMTFFITIAKFLKTILPQNLSRILNYTNDTPFISSNEFNRKIIALMGCVQDVMTPNVNVATQKLFNKLNVNLIASPKAGCCGALKYHLGESEEGLNQIRNNIDAWWPLVENGAEAIMPTASGCCSFIKKYEELMKFDPIYAHKAKKVTAITKDPSEVLLSEDLALLNINSDKTKVSVHVPCSQQHSLKLPDTVEMIFKKLGFKISTVEDKHLCCGSGGANSFLEPKIGKALRDKKLATLEAEEPDTIVTSNIGCQIHLQSGTDRTIQHWTELLASKIK